MNREIKFRAWDTIATEMYSSSRTNVHINGSIWFRDATGEARENDGRITIMQYTGLKDKNGTEIYEGDIVQAEFQRFDFDKPDGEEMYLETKMSVIEYRGHGFWVKHESFGWEGENLWDWGNMIVIGNIYSNPELFHP